jgi:hypothetical protein
LLFRATEDASDGETGGAVEAMVTVSAHLGGVLDLLGTFGTGLGFRRERPRRWCGDQVIC